MTILQLITRLNEIRKEQDKLELKKMELDNEYNQIVYELWGKIPELKTNEDIQPMKRVRK
jgi:predicted transcriptional regulator